MSLSERRKRFLNKTRFTTYMVIVDAVRLVLFDETLHSFIEIFNCGILPPLVQVAEFVVFTTL